jgi:hypothetical protein
LQISSAKAGFADPQKILNRFASLSRPGRFRSASVADLPCPPGRLVAMLAALD